MRGARAAFQSAVKFLEERSLALIVVWTDMLEKDDAHTAARAAGRYPHTSSVEHFHDPDRTIGKAVAQRVGAPGRIAWDFYLVYPKGATWGDAPPEPLAWFHQLESETWADPDRYRWGRALGPAISEALAELVGEVSS